MRKRTNSQLLPIPSTPEPCLYRKQAVCQPDQKAHSVTLPPAHVLQESALVTSNTRTTPAYLVLLH